MDKDHPLPLDTGRGFDLVYKNKHLYHPKDPVTDVLKKLKRCELKNEVLYFIPSPLFGYGLKEILSRLPEKSFILCVEIDQELMKISLPFLKQFAGNKKIHIVRTDSLAALKSILVKIGLADLRRVERLYISRAASLYSKQYSEMFNFIADEIQQFWRNRATAIHLGQLWLRNLFRNLIWQPPLPSSFSFSRKALMLCGAGPSLEADLPEIRHFRQDLFVLAVDTALPVLIKQGISPDAVITLDAQWFNAMDFLGSNQHDYIILSDLTANPNIHFSLKKSAVFFLSSFYQLDFFQRLQEASVQLPLFPAMGSVGVLAIYLATKKLKAPLIISGLDFSFYKGLSHSRGSPFHQLNLNNWQRFSGIQALRQHFDYPKVLPLQEGLYTTPNLRQYFQSAMELLKQAESPVFCGKQGMAHQSYLPSLKNHRDWQEFLERQNQSDIKLDWDNLDKQKIKLFLNKEKNLIVNLQEKIKESGIRVRRDEDFLRLLKKLDYLYFFFPDAQRPLTSSFLSRVYHQASYLLRLIDNQNFSD